MYMILLNRTLENGCSFSEIYKFHKKKEKKYYIIFTNNDIDTTLYVYCDFTR